MRNVLHLLFGQAATTALTILLNATLARALGSSDFGRLFLVMSIATFVYVVVDWGHGQFIIRETARHPDKAGNLLGTVLVLRSSTVFVACVPAVAATWLLGYDEPTQLLTVALIVAWLPQYNGLSFGWVFRGLEMMHRDALLNVVLKLATLILSVVCLALGGRLVALTVAWALAGCITLAMGMATYRKLGLPKLGASMATSRMLLRGGAPMFTMMLAVAVEPLFNANILYKMSSPAVVAWYGAAWTIGGTLMAPATVVGATMYPRLSTVASDPEEFRRVFEVSFRPLLLLGVLGAVGTYLFADVPVGLIYSLKSFGPAADTLRMFAPVLLLLYVDILLGAAIFALGRAGRIAGPKLASIVVTAAVAFAFVPWCQARFGNGGLGVMYAMMLGECLMLVAHVAVARNAVDRRGLLNQMLRSLAAGGATIALFRLLPAFTPVLAIPLCVLVFAVMAVLAGAVKRSDLEMLLGYFPRRRVPQG
jgi:O-antigen/teichoic acid export membrane protein